MNDAKRGKLQAIVDRYLAAYARGGLLRDELKVLSACSIALGETAAESLTRLGKAGARCAVCGSPISRFPVAFRITGDDLVVMPVCGHCRDKLSRVWTWGGGLPCC